MSLGQQVDEYAAMLKREYPDRFLFAASLPVPEMDAAIRAVDVAYDELGADAVKLPTNADGLYPGDAHYDSLFERLNERQAVVFFIQPRQSVT